MATEDQLPEAAGASRKRRRGAAEASTLQSRPTRSSQRRAAGSDSPMLPPSLPLASSSSSSTVPTPTLPQPTTAALPPTPAPSLPRRKGAFLSLSASAAFDLIVVGCGGGPREDNLSAYFLKSAARAWEDGFVGLEGGSGLGAVSRLLEEEELVLPERGRDAGADEAGEGGGGGAAGGGKGKKAVVGGGKGWRGKGEAIRKGGPFGDFEAVRKRNPSSSTRPTDPSIPFTPLALTTPLTPSPLPTSAPPDPSNTTTEPDSPLSGHIYAPLRSFLLSHAHFDHMASLVLTAGALMRCPKELWGLARTCENALGVFDGGVWPKLAAREHRPGLPLWVRELPTEHAPEKGGVSVCPSLTVRAHRVAHGVLPTITPHPSPSKPLDPSKPSPLPSIPHPTNSHPGEPPTSNGDDAHPSSPSSDAGPPDPYDSTAFFITDASTSKELLFFGDVGPDSVSGLDWNRRVWEEAARVRGEGRLAAVFIECSYPSLRKREQLYGHLSPPFLFEELSVFASLCSPTDPAEPDSLVGRLSGLPVIIIHVKDDAWPLPTSALPPTPHPLGPGKVPAPESMRDWIGHEIEELEGATRLGCTFVMARQGDRFEF